MKKTEIKFFFSLFLGFLLGQLITGAYSDVCLYYTTSASSRRVRISVIEGLLPPPANRNLPSPRQWQDLKTKYGVAASIEKASVSEGTFKIAEKDYELRIAADSLELRNDIIDSIKQKYSDNKDYDLLIKHLLAKDKGITKGRIRLLVDDTGQMRYEGIEDVSWSEVEGAILYVHLSKQFYDRYKDSPEVIARAIVREYEKLFLPEYILSAKSNPLGKRDNLIESADKFAAKGDKEELIKMLQEYDPTIDTSFTLKNRILKALYEIYQGDPESIITTGEDLLIWYRVQREFVGDNLPRRSEKEGYIFKLSSQMREMEQAGKIAKGLLPQAPKQFNDYFLAVEITGQTIYLPNINISLKEHGFKKTGYIYNEAAIKLLEQAIEEASGDIDVLLDKIEGYELANGSVFLLGMVAEKIKAVRAEIMAEIMGLRAEIADLKAKEETTEVKKAIKTKEDSLGKITNYVGEDITKIEGVRNLLQLAVYDQVMVGKLIEEIETQGSGRDNPLIVTITAAGGAGKSTLAEYLKLALEKKGLTAALRSTDDYLYPRQFRYAPRDVEGGREMQGAAMYNWRQLIADMQALKRNEEVWLPGEKDPVNTAQKRLNVMILEGCLAAHGVSLREVADIKVGISEWDDIDRFCRKLARDTDPHGPRKYTPGWVIFDFAGKPFHEQTDIIMRDLIQGSDFVWRYTSDRGWIFERIRQPVSTIESPLALFSERYDYIYAFSDYGINLQPFV